MRGLGHETITKGKYQGGYDGRGGFNLYKQNGDGSLDKPFYVPPELVEHLSDLHMPGDREAELIFGRSTRYVKQIIIRER